MENEKLAEEIKPTENTTVEASTQEEKDFFSILDEEKQKYAIPDEVYSEEEPAEERVKKTSDEKDYLRFQSAVLTSGADVVLPIILLLIVNKLTPKKVNINELKADKAGIKLIDDAVYQYLLATNADLPPGVMLAVTVGSVYGSNVYKIIND